ncbi:toll/interleukin-1 receptor domain-containing protein [Frankia gtarii]|uniref:toll/interleukin-1 receptor domain-containing protein n=1 Tax=Frankia gtarii TaxID=2950102 RepID=UPI0021BF6B2F|nr:TIR domain-containing protein [Frankia gtarii]
MSGVGHDAAGWDFFVSYTAVDRQWAEWVAWQLEDAGHRVLIQAWDFVAGSNWHVKMQEGVTQATRTIAVLSDSYLASVYGKEEWQAAHAADPRGLARKLLPVRVEDCDRPGLLGAVVSIDLFDLSPDEARSYLLVQVRGALDGRVKPDIEPAFPVRPRQTSPERPPSFPHHQRPPQPRSAKPPLMGEPFTSHTGAVQSVAFGLDGRILAAGGGDGVWLWDVSNPGQPHAIDKSLDGSDNVISAVFGRDGRVLATGSEKGVVRLWDITDPGQPRAIDRAPTLRLSAVTSLAFSPDGRTLFITGSQGMVYQVNIPPIEEPYHPFTALHPFNLHNHTALSVGFSRFGHILASSRDCAVQLWDISNPSEPDMIGDPLSGHTDLVESAVFSPDGQTLATGSDDKKVWLWDVSDPSRPRAIGMFLTGHINGLWSMAFGPDGKTLATSIDDGVVRLRDISSPSRPHIIGEFLTGYDDPIWSVAFRPDGKVLATGSEDGTLRLWNLK